MGQTTEHRLLALLLRFRRIDASPASKNLVQFIFSARISKSWTVGDGSDLTATAQRSKLDVKHPCKHDHSYGSEEVIRNKLVLR